MGKIDLKVVRESWGLFDAKEKRNIAIYIVGIMLYKFGLEAFNGSITALATNRYDQDARLAGTTPRTFERIGLLQGLNQAFQCVGSILIAPLIKRYPTRLVLSVAILVFGLFTAILLIVDAATGGKIKPNDWEETHTAAELRTDFSYFGNYNTDGIIPIYCVTGIAYGMVELIRRVIPRDIVGGNVQKLRRMDATVHIFYEVAGTAGAFATALGLIPALGYNYSFLITPIFFTAASIVWFFISNYGFVKTPHLRDAQGNRNYFKSIWHSIVLFFESIYTGGVLVFTNRKFIWLLPGYAFALYGHRYLENGIAPFVARRYLGVSAWSQIMVGGSNFGELLGALFVFLFTNLVARPMPWLRLDALLLLIVWYLPYYTPPQSEVRYAWIVAATFIPISFGWAAGDVSLAAYIQASLARTESKMKNVSALGAVMAFLYSTYIVIYAIANPLLGRYLDRQSALQAAGQDGAIQDGVRSVAGIQFTILAAIVIASTFIPKGAISFNPKMISDELLDSDIGDDKADLKDISSGEEILDSEKGGLAPEPDHEKRTSITLGLEDAVRRTSVA
ncbi:hypothetical protein EJ05DRAFT_453393 [Pseudovirgaria hyperparasitica]|uniref:MFS general substrate transporter n=1 Tax=Pseudovirgaria hyperparasitica TaxID=470096 RepID=A0A6A6W7N1_9PEZI|nr:uncharacterized protein EJ05DRAFT_453393 [Pseudovirgaria hyperparasitica]KAF2757587.1 hypothetical protein EJ05DRAFT_453393 [Pseudovirgaria hyperparasitica]